MILQLLDNAYNVVTALWEFGKTQHAAKVQERKLKEWRAFEVRRQWTVQEYAARWRRYAQERANKRVLDSISEPAHISAKALKERGLKEGWLITCPGCSGKGQTSFVHYQGGMRHETPIKCGACNARGYYKA